MSPTSGAAFDGEDDRLGAINLRNRVARVVRLMNVVPCSLLDERRPKSPHAIPSATSCQDASSKLVVHCGSIEMGKFGHDVRNARNRVACTQPHDETSDRFIDGNQAFAFDHAVRASERSSNSLSRAMECFANELDSLPPDSASSELNVDCAGAVRPEIVAMGVAHFRACLVVSKIVPFHITVPDGWSPRRANELRPPLAKPLEAWYIEFEPFVRGNGFDSAAGVGH
jgi:hypothetical protein